jgi:hypothetical protein
MINTFLKKIKIVKNMPKKEQKQPEEIIYIIEFTECRLLGVISSCATYCAITQRSLPIINETSPAAISYPNVGDSDNLLLNIILNNGFLNLQVNRLKNKITIVIQKEKAQLEKKKDIENEMINNFIQYFVNEFEIEKVRITSLNLNQSGTAKTGIKIENINCNIENVESSEKENTNKE